MKVTMAGAGVGADGTGDGSGLDDGDGSLVGGCVGVSCRARRCSLLAPSTPMMLRCLFCNVLRRKGRKGQG